MTTPRSAAALAVPVGQAVAAEAGEVHQIQVLHLGALAQVPHQVPEGVGRGGVVEFVRIRGHGGVRIAPRRDECSL
jgi:hypothetical protein